MADIKGTNVSAPIAPWTDEDAYATHFSLYGKGGWRTVNDLAERDAITVQRREEGMPCYVISENKVYQLIGGIENTNWLDGLRISIPQANSTVLGGLKADARGVGDNVEIRIDTVSGKLFVDLSTAVAAANEYTDDELGDLNTALSASIAAETLARTNADTTLQGAITTEEQARAAADTTLQNNIDDEETARIAADQALNNNKADKYIIPGEGGDPDTVVDPQYNYNKINSDLADEATVRNAMDVELADRIAAISGTVARLPSKDFGDPATYTSPTYQETLTAYAVSLHPSWGTDGVPNAVVVMNMWDNHDWIHNELGDEWVDNGLNNVSTFTNQLQGVILGSTDAWKVNAQANGTGLVNTTIATQLVPGLVLSSSASLGVSFDAYGVGTVNDLSTLLAQKQAAITGAATSITAANLTANMVLASDASGKVAVSSTGVDKLAYLNNVTSDIQTQINAANTAIQARMITPSVGHINVGTQIAPVVQVDGTLLWSPVAGSSISVVAVNSAATTTIDLNVCMRHDVTLTGATTIALSNATPAVGTEYEFEIRIITGASLATVTWFGNLTWVETPDPLAANTYHCFVFRASRINGVVKYLGNLAYTVDI